MTSQIKLVVVTACVLVLACGAMAATFADCVYPPVDVKTAVAPNWQVTKGLGPTSFSNWPDSSKTCWGLTFKKITTCDSLQAGSAERVSCETNNGWLSDFIVTPSCTNLTRANVGVIITDFGQCFPPFGTNTFADCTARITYKDDSPLQACGYKTGFPWSNPPDIAYSQTEFTAVMCWDLPNTGLSCPSYVTYRQGDYINQVEVPNSSPCCGEWSNYKEDSTPPPPPPPPTDPPAPPSGCPDCELKKVGDSTASPCNSVSVGSTSRCLTLQFVDSAATCQILP